MKFHLQGIDAPDEAWEKLNTVFGIQNEIRAHQLENELLTLDPNTFSCMEDFITKFKTLRVLLAACEVTKGDDGLIYAILAKLGPAYSVFLSTVHSTKEAFISSGTKYKPPSFDAFCDSLIREQEKLLHLGLINTASTSTKALVAQQPHGPKNPKNHKKQHPKKNIQNNRGPKSFQPQNTPQNDKNFKSKGKKPHRHCNFCNQDGHKESGCHKRMEALEATMKKHHIQLDSSSNSSSGQALSTYGFVLNVSSCSSSNEWLIDSRASYHMAKDKAMFSSLNDCNTKHIFVGDDRSLSVVGSGTVHLDNGQINDVLCVPTLSCNLLSTYQITHSGEGKTVEFTPHQVVIRS